jgi:serine/threonine protein kinase
LIKEYINGETLNNFIKKHIHTREKIGKNTIQHIFYQICIGVYYLHMSNIMHRDLKPSNIMIDSDGSVKIIDFGYASNTIHDFLVCGTPNYMSPEMWKKKYYSCKVDCWSLGVILYYMVNLELPYLAKDYKELRKKIVFGTYNKKYDVNNEEENFIISKLLLHNTDDRISIKDLLCTKYMKNASLNYIENIKKSNMENSKKNNILEYIEIVNQDLLLTQ